LPSMRIVLDTNIVVSSLLWQGLPEQVWQKAKENKIRTESKNWNEKTKNEREDSVTCPLSSLEFYTRHGSIIQVTTRTFRGGLTCS
jgi:predicted nucleic acid-binding protein